MFLQAKTRIKDGDGSKNSTMLTTIKRKAFFWKDYYKTDFLIRRRRGDEWVPELTQGVRFKYDSKPNAHILKTGEEIPAIPLDFVETQPNGRNFIQVAEVEDSQYSPVKDDLENLEDRLSDYRSDVEIDEENIQTYDALSEEIVEEEVEVGWKKHVPFLEPDTEVREVTKETSTEKMFVPLKTSIDQEEAESTVINNKDQKLNFWLDHLKEKNDKYTIPGFVAENKQMIMTVITAVAVAIIMYASYSTWGSGIEGLNQNLPSFTDAIQNAAQQGTGGGGAPGQ
jgi:hypothetical protein